MSDTTLMLKDIFDNNRTNRYLSTFCTRVCHDLLGPAGALSMIIDTASGAKDKLEECSDRLLLYIDMLRRAYGFSSSGMNLGDFTKIAKVMFEDKIDLSELKAEDIKANPALISNLCRCMVWLFFKTMDKSRIYIESVYSDTDKEVMTGSILVRCTGFYFTDQEMDFVKDKPVEMDAYIIYLILFFRYLDDSVSATINISQTECTINIVNKLQV